MQTGNASAASQAFERALTTDPGDYGTHLNLALFAFETQGLEQGLAWLKKAQVLNPQEPQAFLIEAQAMAQSGEPAKARTILEALLQRDPSLEPAKQLLKSLE